MAQDDSDNALHAFRSYAHAFQSLDPDAVARHFHEPALLITPHEVAAMWTRAEVSEAYARIMATVPAQGYAGTESLSMEVQHLGDELALVTGSGVWKRATGEAFAPFGMAYTLRRSSAGWRIIVAAIYPQESRTGGRWMRGESR